MKREKKPKKEGWIMPGGEKLALMLGAGCTQAFTLLVSTFLTGYLLIAGIDLKISATILLVLKVWDAVNDVLFGYLVDRIRFKPGKNWFSRWLFSGRYMPWFRFLLFLMPLGAILIFTIGSIGPTAKLIQFTIGYLLYDLGMTASGAYNLLPMSVTANYEERNFITAFSGLLGGFGSLPVVVIGTALIAAGVPYSVVVPALAVWGFILGALPALFVKERNPSAVLNTADEKYTLKQMLQAVKLAPDYIAMLAATFISGIFATAQFGLMLSFYIFDNAGVAAIITAASILPSIVFVPFLPALFKRVDKMVVARLGYGVSVVCSLIMVILGRSFFDHQPDHLWLSVVLSIISISGTTLANFGMGMIGPDIMEKAKYKSGRDVAGIFGAMASFISKAVGAVTSSVALLILGAYGWNSNFSASSYEELAVLVEQGVAVQTDRALQGLWDVSYLYPLIGAALAFICYFFVRVGRRDAQIYMSANAGEITREKAEELLADKTRPLV